MFEPSQGPRVFALPPGADFPTLLAQGLRARLAGQPPEAMARVEVLVNTARMQARLRDALIAQGPGFLPRIRLIADLGGEAPGTALRIRLELAQLIRQLLAAEPDLGPPAAAFSLAESLFSLLDEMHGEGVSLDVLHRLDVSQHSLHWERSLRFIRLVARFLGPTQGAQAQLREAVQRISADWALRPPQHPVIVAGSTGSRGPTALLMQAVARLPQGAVVLPGFDAAMPTEVWQGLSDPLQDEDHPQFRFARLLGAMGVVAQGVQPWTATPPPDPARNALVSLALRPAPVTDQWLHEGPRLGDMVHATRGLSLIEAASPRHEALAIALRLRDAAVVGKKAALITPDRTLARRVTAVLDRWHLRPDDSAGRPLSLSAPGRFLRQSAALMASGATAEALITLLKHPIAHSATDRGPHLRHTRDLELHLRAKAIPFPQPEWLLPWAERAEDRLDWAAWVIGIVRALDFPTEQPLTDWVAAHRHIITRLAAGPAGADTGELWKTQAGEDTRALFDSLDANAAYGGRLTSIDYSALLETLFVGAVVREAGQSHPSVMIWGTLEARAQGADLVVLGGLNEGVWPSSAQPDPWFNRQMRLDAGLLLPERQIGLSAHDFQQAIGAPEVVLSRARRNAEAETIPSRWLNRLTNLIAGLPAQRGAAALADMRARGSEWLRLADAYEADLSGVPPAAARRNPRPAPAPPASARLNDLSVTRVETLIRDPFAIYAESVLRLRPLDPLAPEADARQRGTALHRIPDLYVRDHPPGTRGSLQAFFAIAETVLAQECPWQATRAHWLARLERVAAGFVAWNAGLNSRPVLMEKKGTMTLGSPPFALTGKPDRIDADLHGRLWLFDYKTGSLPGDKQIKFFNKQLILLALMVEDDAFGLGPAEVAGAKFIGLGSRFDQRDSPTDAESLAGHRAAFLALIDTYRRPEQGFTSRRAIDLEARAGEYDALARRGEWEDSDPAQTIIVGGADG